jgi:hypothetical protein
MKIFQTLFGLGDEAKLARAKKFMAEGRYNDARLEASELEDVEARGVHEAARTALASINLEEAEARYSSGDYQGAQEHIELASAFGASDQQLRTVRSAGRDLRRERAAKAERSAREKAKIVPVGDDPIWSLPPDHPRVRYAMRIKSYPQEVQKRLVALGGGFADAVLLIEDGKASEALVMLDPFVESDAAARFERARAAILCGASDLAISDLMVFGKEVGHCEIDGMHTGATLSRLLQSAGREAEAMEQVGGLLESDAHPSLRLASAELMESRGDLGGASKALKSLVVQFPGDIGLVRRLARVQLKEGDRQAASGSLESVLQRCCTPGQCGSKPLDLPAARMLARIYLEDRVAGERSRELLGRIGSMSREPTWEDQYLSALSERNNASPYTRQLSERLLRQLSPSDPRRGWVQASFGAA